jgi:peptide chain release factor
MSVYIQNLEKKMKETWNHHLQVERGNPVRTFQEQILKRIIRTNHSKNRGIFEK